MTLGAVYVLIALAYTMIYGILKPLNFTHGDVYMVGAYIGYFVFTGLGGLINPRVPIVVLISLIFLAAMLGFGLLGVAIERFAYRPLRNAPRIAPLITALGVSLALLAVAGLAVIVVAVATAATDSGRAPASNAATAAASCKKPTIGMSAPITGPAGSIGSDQLHWAQYYVRRWNALHPRFKMTLKQFDDQIDPAKAATGAKQFASDPFVLAVIGPMGSQQVVAAAPIYKKAKLAIVSGSATRVSLTDGSLKGTFFRVVPNDGIQGPSDVNYAMSKLGVKSNDRVMLVDDRKAYGTGLRNIMTRAFEAKGVKVDTKSIAKADTDFTSIVNKTANDKVVFLLTQIATQSQLLAQQMKEKGRTAIVFASDGSFDPTKFNVNGSYVSFFAPDVTTLASAKSIVNGFYAKFGHATTPFGAPNYVVAQLEIAAIQKACADGKVSRGEVRKLIAKTNMKGSLLGVPIKFTGNGDVMGAKFFIFKIVNGKYVVVG